MDQLQTHNGFALVCSIDGVVGNVVYDDIGIEIKEGDSFFDFLDTGSKQKGENFLHELRYKGAALDWNLNFHLKGEIHRFYFSGGEVDEQFLIIGLQSRDVAQRFYEELMKITNEQTISLRAALKRTFSRSLKEQPTDHENYNELIRLNNELITVQRELTKKKMEAETLNAKLKEEIKKARLLHERSLPDYLPETKQYAFAAYYKPTEGLGGDFYNVIEKEDHVVLYLTDVTGHGLDGAMLTVFIKEAINSFLHLLGNEEIHPSSILNHLSNAYCKENFPYDYFICIFLGVLNKKTGTLTYVSAGFQPQPLHARSDGQREELPTGGLPISTVLKPHLLAFSEKKTEVPKGSSLLITTDGLTEETNNDTPYEQRLQEIFFSHAHLPPEMIIKTITQDFHEFTGSNIGKDDITFLVLQGQNLVDELSVTIDSTLEEATRLRDTVETFITPYLVDKDMFMIGFHEMLINAVEHGNEQDPRKKTRVFIYVRETYIRTVIEDEGSGFEWWDRSESMNHELFLSERGRGIALTNMSCNYLGYNSTGNRVCLIQLREAQDIQV